MNVICIEFIHIDDYYILLSVCLLIVRHTLYFGHLLSL